MKAEEEQSSNPYRPDYRLSEAYEKANLLDEKGIEELCPSYLELSEISDRYQDETLIGKGGVKEVYKAYDNRTRRWLALARLREDRGPAFYDHFVHEAWLVSTLDHPNIIKVHDVRVDPEGRPFFTMDLKEGSTLAAQLGVPNQKILSNLLQVFIKVCDAVSYAHAQGILHLDLKPENIQIEDHGEVLVCDWGLGKKIGAEGNKDLTNKSEKSDAGHWEFDNMTLVGEIKGSPGFMAPEQVTPAAHKDQRTDIFSLGCILHAIVIGEPPFKGDPKEVLEQTAACAPPVLQRSSPKLKIQRSLEAVILKTLQKEPDARYQSVDELREEIQRYLDGYSTHAKKSDLIDEARLFVSRNRPQMLIGLSAVILLTLLSFLFIDKYKDQQRLIQKEGERAEEFELEAESVHKDYLETLGQSQQMQLDFAAELALSANKLKNMGIFESPCPTVQEAKRLASNALTLDPNQRQARYELFALNLITLNSREALNYSSSSSPRKSYCQFAKKFPDLSYDEKLRPEAKELAHIIQNAGPIGPEINPLLERIIAFDSKGRIKRNSYCLPLSQLVKNINPPHLQFSIEPDLANSSLRLKAESPIKLICSPGGSGRCILRYFPTRFLLINSPAEFDLAELSYHPVQVLDLRACAKPIASNRVFLPNLSEVKIAPGQVESQFLKKQLSSRIAFKISESPLGD